MIQISTYTSPSPSQGLSWRVSRSNTDIQVWDGSDKTGPYLTNANGIMDCPVTPDNTLWVEWVRPPFGSTSAFELSVWDSLHNRKVFFDEINFQPVNSVVVMLGGRLQDNPADPPIYPAEEGMFAQAIEEYRHSGLDVYMYAHQAVAPGTGAGAAYDMVRSAINERNVMNVAIMGYSWGGGGTHDLANRLQTKSMGVNPEITGFFTIPFTSYVDGIENGGMAAETSRPPMSAFHLGQYETNTLLIHGLPSGGDVDLDRTAMELFHTTIDDHPVVLQVLSAGLRAHVNP